MKKTRSKIALLVSIAFLVCGVFAPQTMAFAQENDGEQPLSVLEQQEEQALEDLPFQEASIVDHSRFDEKLMAQRRDEEGVFLNNSPDDIREATLPNTGNAYMLGFHVIFPDAEFEEADNEDAFQAAIGVSTAGQIYDPLITNQYSDLHSYYERSSYGKLSISGDIYTYNAKQPKKSYLTEEELLMEALAEMDDEIDYNQYDANGDNVIDAICLHVPEDESVQWAELWWPKCSPSTTKETFDDCLPGAWIVLSRNLTTEMGLKTLIHESGHAIGFPDYYAYEGSSLIPDPSYLTGIQTFDMMNDNLGDHNGFSKWMAGWLTEQDITMVEVNENGASAVRGGSSVGTVNEDGSITLDLERFCTDDLSQTGGFIAVGNDFTNGLFSTFYLIQYDSFAGNQKVYYRNNNEEDMPIPSGFRVFRVQAELDVYGNMKYTNTYGAIHNQLIELVDPDLDEYHFQRANVAPSTGAEQYGCMFLAGDQLSPVTRPSSNIHEVSGFTGIQIDFLSAEETGGSLTISYTNEGKPEEIPLEFDVAGNGLVPGENAVVLQPNQKISAGELSYPYAMIDNNGANLYYLRNVFFNSNKNTVNGTLFFDTDMLSRAHSVKLRFVEGSFFAADGKPSEDLLIELPINENLVQLEDSGTYPDTQAVDPNAVHFLTDIRKAEDGGYYFYGYSCTGSPHISDDTRLFRYSFTEKTLQSLTVEELVTGSIERDEAVAQMQDHNKHITDNAQIVPENAALGDYPVVLDAVEDNGCYYVLSAQYELDDYTHMDNELALSKLDENANLISQTLPFENQYPQAFSRNKLVRLQKGPGRMIAVQIYGQYNFRDTINGNLFGSCHVLFYDSNLELSGLTGGYSSGCGTWLKDGSYLLVGQRDANLYIDDTEDEIRNYSLSYDQTEVIDPVQPEEVPIEKLILPAEFELAAGTSTLLQPFFKPEDTTQTELIWNSSDTAVAKVDTNGKVTGAARGMATITATSKSNSEIKASCIVMVKFSDAYYDLNGTGQSNVSKEMETAINWAADNKITGEKVKFGTNNSITRGQFVRFLYRYANEPKVTSNMIKKYGSKFSDVDKNYTHFKAIIWAVSKGLIAGYEDGTFKPNKKLTRKNLATILWKYTGSPKVSNAVNPFSDVAKSTAITWGKNKKIFTGIKFYPGNNCLRCDAAVFLYLYDKVK